MRNIILPLCLLISFKCLAAYVPSPDAPTMAWANGSFIKYTDTLPSFVMTTAGANIAVASLTTSIATKFTSPAGSVAQYLRGDGTLATFPSTAIKLYDKSGLITSALSQFSDTFSIASATPTISFAAYMSSQGWGSFKIKSATGYRVGATASNAPQVAITALTSNSATFIVNQTNTATVTILGISVLSGLPIVNIPDPQNAKIILSMDVW